MTARLLRRNRRCRNHCRQQGEICETKHATPEPISVSNTPMQVSGKIARMRLLMTGSIGRDAFENRDPRRLLSTDVEDEPSIGSFWLISIYRIARGSAKFRMLTLRQSEGSDDRSNGTVSMVFAFIQRLVREQSGLATVWVAPLTLASATLLAL